MQPPLAIHNNKLTYSNVSRFGHTDMKSTLDNVNISKNKFFLIKVR